MSKITFVSSNTLDTTITFAIDAKRYEYQLANPTQLDCAMYMIRKVSSAKAFSYVKKRGKLMENANG